MVKQDDSTDLNGQYPQLRFMTSQNKMALEVWGLCTENDG